MPRSTKRRCSLHLRSAEISQNRSDGWLNRSQINPEQQNATSTSTQNIRQIGRQPFQLSFQQFINSNRLLQTVQSVEQNIGLRRKHQIHQSEIQFFQCVVPVEK